MALKCSSSGSIPTKGSSNRWFCQVQPHQAHPVKRWTSADSATFLCPHQAHPVKRQTRADSATFLCPHQAHPHLAESAVDSTMCILTRLSLAPSRIGCWFCHGVPSPDSSTPARTSCWFCHARPCDMARLVHTWQNRLLIPPALHTLTKLARLRPQSRNSHWNRSHGNNTTTTHPSWSHWVCCDFLGSCKALWLRVCFGDSNLMITKERERERASASYTTCKKNLLHFDTMHHPWVLSLETLGAGVNQQHPPMHHAGWMDGWMNEWMDGWYVDEKH
jgi:hypothetical protein